MATPVQALRAECGLPSPKAQFSRLVLKASEKAPRLPDDHPRKIALDSGPTQGRQYNETGDKRQTD